MLPMWHSDFTKLFPDLNSHPQGPNLARPLFLPALGHCMNCHPWVSDVNVTLFVARPPAHPIAALDTLFISCMTFSDLSLRGDLRNGRPQDRYCLSKEEQVAPGNTGDRLKGGTSLWLFHRRVHMDEGPSWVPNSDKAWTPTPAWGALQVQSSQEQKIRRLLPSDRCL